MVKSPQPPEVTLGWGCPSIDRAPHLDELDAKVRRPGGVDDARVALDKTATWRWMRDG